MAIEALLSNPDFTHIAGPKEGEIAGVFCCDLLSLAMSKAKTGGVWVTVMNNINTLAVAALCEVPLVIFAHGVCPDEAMRQRAETEGITLAGTNLPVFEAATLAATFAPEAE